MTTLKLTAHGAAPVELAWERYADPQLWHTWAPQIQRVQTEMQRLRPGGSGTVHAGPFARPTVPVPFQVVHVDEETREWSWKVRLGLIHLHLEHGVTPHLTGSSTWLRIRGPLPVVLVYVPVARMAMNRLVAQ